MSVRKNTSSLSFAILLGLGLVASANQVAAQQNTPPQVATSREDAQPGAPYTLGTFGDWTVRCIRVESGQVDPCEMNQLLSTVDGNPTAEINLFPVGREGVPAGATIVTPLETLLTQNMRLSIDQGTEKVYPFQLCTRQGCVVQLGLTPEELNQMKSGSQALLTIVPAAAPDRVVELAVSLNGFTAAFSMLDVVGLE
ncbi:invasion associated locus B family protein [Meridianimarinicoccus aquatilis]|uniref:Invasion associated locus B family protein n=1 Tax=Meridianimarinicoccus aquatilis TaxID=2552766 RepID=A0A4R6B4F1_9RHOB|nr:invasion associated locus B family protein [Fluviibacterium aquatile]QIE42313.1 invasion associated locus B family protein [Rhodobacteraceae bacterium SC52]TDL91284.1 invasion associated locus B family protein [Fluviibacterium aquatile]